MLNEKEVKKWREALAKAKWQGEIENRYGAYVEDTVTNIVDFIQEIILNDVTVEDFMDEVKE